MGSEALPDREALGVPPKAATEWLELRHVLETFGPVACHTGDPAAWTSGRHLGRDIARGAASGAR